MKRSRITVAAVVTAVLFATGALTAAAASDSDIPPPPPAPEWVNADGTIDESKLPSEMPVVGPDGQDLKDAKGNPVMVDPNGGELDYVPNCGVGLASGAVPSANAAVDPEPRTCTDIPPVPDRGDAHSVETDSNGDTVEVVDVGDDAPFVP
ncbi:hypothetical protein OG936_11870 [Streptomyces sp. NBC_00846]|uniref:hypothetical protein n=1 Tax=Streptomyces sp. NBC_00846 TaxID=2975849 RepID=UPI003868D1CD|nr:hypothetical protein OG936_11870 [Streptomyces sp. NBC_00846]